MFEVLAFHLLPQLLPEPGYFVFRGKKQSDQAENRCFTPL
jgi:hypothetical protein